MKVFIFLLLSHKHIIIKIVLCILFMKVQMHYSRWVHNLYSLGRLAHSITLTTFQVQTKVKSPHEAKTTRRRLDQFLMNVFYHMFRYMYKFGTLLVHIYRLLARSC